MDQKEIEEKLKNFQVKHIEKPEKKEEPEKNDPDMEPLFGQEDKIEEAGEENGQTEEPEIRESEKNSEEEPPADNAAEEAPQKKKFFSRFRKKKEKEHGCCFARCFFDDRLPAGAQI